MKKIYTYLFIMMIIAPTTYATPHFNCEINKNGTVFLTYIFSQNTPQKLSTWIGDEKWSRPFAIRTACEHLKFEIINTPEEKWTSFECKNDFEAEATKYIIFPLTDKGHNILQTQLGSTDSYRLIFRPQTPIQPNFVDKKSEPGCDPY